MDASSERLQRFRQAVAGDRAAFADLVREHQAMVYSLAYQLVRDPGGAEEIAQEVFLDFYRNLSAIGTPEHATNWLRRVASHRAIDYSRRVRNRRGLPLDVADEPSVEPRAIDPLLSERLRRLIGKLPEAARAVVLLRYQEDLDPVDIAKTLEMPLNTVKSHLQRSLAVLRHRLQPALRQVR